MKKGVQRIYAPNSICFGCGPANSNGLRIESMRYNDGLFANFFPKDEHQAFPGIIAGGIIGTLLDCHGNWTAAISLMDFRKEKIPPTTVTASYSVQLRKPTPAGVMLEIKSKIISIEDPIVKVSLELFANDDITAFGEGKFVAITEGHPAFHRWS